MSKRIHESSVTVILMRGYPGCGKSSLANALSNKYQVPVVDKDDGKDALQKLANVVDDAMINQISYDIMLNVTRKQLSNGLSVIVDSPLSRKCLYHQLKHIATTFGATVVVVECSSSDHSIWNNRLVHRRANTQGSFHKPSDLQQVLNLIQSYGGDDLWQDDDPLVHHIALDTTITQSLEDQIRYIEDYFKRKELYLN